MTGINFLTKNQENAESAIENKVPEPTYFEKNKSSKIALNISGLKYEISFKHLKRIPTSRLAQIYYANDVERINEFCDNFNPQENELYFDRDPVIFNNILNYYRSGKLHVLENVCPVAYKDELNYWGISELLVDDCCNMKFYLKQESVLEDIKKNQDTEIKVAEKEEFKNCCPSFRKKLWNILDKPETSCYAKVNFILTIINSIIFISYLKISTIFFYNCIFSKE